MKSPGSSRRSSLGLRPWGWVGGAVVVAAFVVVVAGSLFTLADGLLEDVSASAVTDLVDDSDAFLHDSALYKASRKIQF